MNVHTSPSACVASTPGSLLRGREKLRSEATHSTAYLLGVISPSSLASMVRCKEEDQHGTGTKTAWE